MIRSHRRSIAARLLVLARVFAHVLVCLLVAAALFPHWNDQRRQAAIRRWSRRLLSILRVRIRRVKVSKHLPERCLLVLNHLSWVDVLLLSSLHPAKFVAKAEIARWPLLGLLARRVGTVFIERGSRSAARRTNEHISAALASGQPVACFPEGTTSLGHGVLRFHGALFQPAIDSGAVVQPVALRYVDAGGRQSESSAYVGDDSLIDSLWRIISHPPVTGELNFLDAVDASGWDRRSLANSLHDEIARALQSAPARRQLRKAG